MKVRVAVAAALVTFLSSIGWTGPSWSATDQVVLHGQVLTSSGLPVPGVFVGAWKDAGVVTDAEGRFVIRLGAKAPRYAWVSGQPIAGEVGAVLPNSQWWEYPFTDGLSGPASEQKVLVLPPVEEFPIVLLDAAGQPVPGARGTATMQWRLPWPVHPSDDGMGGPAIITWDVPADQSGTATLRSWFTPVTAGGRWPSGDGCLVGSATAKPSQWPVTATRPVETPLATSSGTVVGPGGGPVGGVTVRSTSTWPLSDGGTRSVACEAVVGADGSFTFEWLTGGGATTILAGPGPEPVADTSDATQWSVRAHPTGGAVTVALPEVVTVIFRIVDASGDPVPGAVAEVSSFDEELTGEQVWTGLVTDSRGQIRIRSWRGTGQGPYLSVEVTRRTPAGVASASMEATVPVADPVRTLRLGNVGEPSREWGVPGPPRHVRAVRVGNRVRVTWRGARTNGLPVSSYELYPAGGTKGRLPPRARSVVFRPDDLSWHYLTAVTAYDADRGTERQGPSVRLRWK